MSGGCDRAALFLPRILLQIVPWVLYSRRGCHLCEAAEDIVLAYRSDVVVIDVDRDAPAGARFDLRVPVLEIDGVVVVEGRFDEATIARLAAGPVSDAQS